ncbi:MAG: hypothetical protein JXR96_09940 [Deltaproteobacteria bacterium]|nr:hypothetical protein [Deltaproteobacteria bacterium]
MVRPLPVFDLATVVQLSEERRETIVQQLHRFSKAGKIIPLRRGMYALAEPYRKVPVQTAELASLIYRPSYLSELWALSYYGLIPEAVPVFTSVSTRKPRRFQCEFGEYRYKNVKASVFFGYTAVELAGRKVILATPEKALVDLWYCSKGEWTPERMREMRISNASLIDPRALSSIVDRIHKPRMHRALSAWRQIRSDEDEGELIP